MNRSPIGLTAIDAVRLKLLAFACGATLAHARSRTGDRFRIADYLGDTDALRHLHTTTRGHMDLVAASMASRNSRLPKPLRYHRFTNVSTLLSPKRS